MTSLIFGAIYLTHKGATVAYRDKQRQKAYERWEGLRDEYDAQKKIMRDARSVDIQSTGSGDFPHNDKPVITLRDLQEANDARTSWRPQESWEQASVIGPRGRPPSTGQSESVRGQVPIGTLDDRSGPVPSEYWATRGEKKPQRTGFTWDDDLPAPLKVSRRTYEDHDLSTYLKQRSKSIQVDNLLPGDQTGRMTHGSGHIDVADVVIPHPPAMHHTSSAPSIPTFSHQPIHNEVPGGPMARLIESGY